MLHGNKNKVNILLTGKWSVHTINIKEGGIYILYKNLLYFNFGDNNLKKIEVVLTHYIKSEIYQTLLTVSRRLPILPLRQG